MTTKSPTGASYYAKRTSLYMKELWRRRDFVWFLAMGNIKARNASTVLGLFWWVLNPLLLGLVYFVVFGLFEKIPGVYYLDVTIIMRCY